MAEYVEYMVGSDTRGTNTNGLPIHHTTQDKSISIKILTIEPYLFESPHQVLLDILLQDLRQERIPS